MKLDNNAFDVALRISNHTIHYGQPPSAEGMAEIIMDCYEPSHVAARQFVSDLIVKKNGEIDHWCRMYLAAKEVADDNSKYPRSCVPIALISFIIGITIGAIAVIVDKAPPVEVVPPIAYVHDGRTQ